MRISHFRTQNWCIPLLSFSSTYWPFSLCKIFKNILTSDPKLWGCAMFGPKMVHLPPPLFFWKKLLKLFSYKYWPLSLCKIFKKFLQGIQSYEDAPFLCPKCPICPNENFFRKPVNKTCSHHSCLSTYQKSMLDIHLLIKYWWLKNTEISLAKSHIWNQIFSKHVVLQNVNEL